MSILSKKNRYVLNTILILVVGAVFVGFYKGDVTMSNFNQVILMGNFTRDPQLSYTPNQTPVVEFGLAVNRKWKGEDGSQREEVLFIECQCYGKRAEVIVKHFTKGNPIFIQGRLKQERWEKDGEQHSRIRIMVENFEFIGRKESDNEPK